MTDFKLEAKVRDEKPKKTRNDGLVPGVIYGKNFENISIAIDQLVFKKLFREAGSSNLIDVQVGNENYKTLIHEVQQDPITMKPLHVDFFKVNMKEKIHAEIPLEFVGESPAVINLEGILITNKDHVEVECLPSDLVSEINVDISILDDFEKNIKVSDIQVPAGIEILDEPDEVVVLVQEPRSEEELEALEEEVVENVENVEVEHKGEETAEGEEAAEGTEEKKPDENKE